MSYPAGLFTYSLGPARVPTSGTDPSVVQLMLAVANNTGHDIVCDQIGITIVAGKGGGQLTESVDGIESSAVAGTRWSPLGEGGNSIWSPDVGHEALHAGESVAFLISNIHVNEVAGLAALTIYETTDVTRVAQVDVTKIAAGLGITGFMASPVQIRPGQIATLTWTTTGAARCTLSPGQGQVDLNGSQQVRPDATMTYTLTAEGKGAAITAQVTVVVPDVRVLNFDATPDQVAKGAITHLTWDVLGASNAKITPGPDQVDPVSGSVDVPVERRTRFLLHVSSPQLFETQHFHDRSDSQQCEVEVVPAEITSFSAHPAVVESGEEAKLTGSTTGASGCVIDPIGNVPVNGTVTVKPTSSTTYRLHADGLEPKTAEAAIVVGAAITSLGLVTDPARPDEVQMDWMALVAGNGSVTLQIGDEQPKPVQSNGVASVKLTAGQRVPVWLRVHGDTGSASMWLGLYGALAVWDTELAKLQISCPAGINTLLALVTVEWAAMKGVVRGWMTVDGGTSVYIEGARGSKQFVPGGAWNGALQVNAVWVCQWEVF